MIFDEAGEEKAFQIIERLRKTIEETNFEQTDKTGTTLDNEYLNITMSFGISQLSKDSGIKIATDWISRADTALYESKQNGRNKTTVYRGI